MFPPTPESAALPSAFAPVGNPPPVTPPPPQESKERSGDASLTRKMMAWKLPMNGASEGVAMMEADSWPALAESAAMGCSKPSSSKIPSPSGSFLDPSSSPSLVPVHQKPNPNPIPVNTGDGVSVNSIDILANAAPATPQPTALKKRNLVGLAVASQSSPNEIGGHTMVIGTLRLYLDDDRRWSLPLHTNMLQPMHCGYFRPSIQAL